MKSSKVPSFEIHKSTTSIPRLNVGEEPTLEANVSELKIPALPQEKNLKAVKKDSPKVHELEKKKSALATAAPAKSLANAKTLAQIPEVKALKEIVDPVVKETQPDTKEIIAFKSQEYKILEGKIYYEFIKNYEMALAHFSELIGDKEFTHEGGYHYALAAAEVGLPTEMRTQLLRVAKDAKSKSLQSDATMALVKNIEKLQTKCKNLT